MPEAWKDEAMGQTVALRVEGMDCGACERRLAAVLRRLDGVGDVSADHVTGVVRVWLDPSGVAAGALAAIAAERIEQAGFTVTGQHEQEDGPRP